MSSPYATTLLSMERGVWASSRARPLAQAQSGVNVGELVTLLLCGVVAGVANFVLQGEFRLPGHAILRAVIPLLFGLSLVPRRGAGSVMGLSALVSVAACRFGGLTGPSPGSLTSLLAIGPLLDLAILGARPGWRIYLRCTAAGLAANLLAFGVRLGMGAAGWKPLKHAGMGGGWRMMLASYAAWGAAAGLFGAVVWFRIAARQDESPESESETSRPTTGTPSPSGDAAP